MDILKMLKAQEELDKAMFDKANIDYYPLQEIVTAYRVELGETLQEWKQFKYWKANKGKIDKSKLLEEIADCIHFALSLQNHYGYCDGYVETVLNLSERTLNKGFFIYESIDDCFTAKWRVLKETLILGLKLGFTLDELEQAYWDKNKINWERIKNNY